MMRFFILLCLGCAASVSFAEGRARGLLIASHKATLSSELSARVVTISKTMGEAFNKGDLLVALDCRLYEAQRDKIAAETNVAKVRLDNSQQLNKLRSIGTLDVAIAESEFKKVQAELRISELNVERCSIYAPFDGVVEQLDVQTFEIVQQQQTVLNIVNRNQLEAEIIVPSSWMSWLSIDQDIQLEVEETGQFLLAKVSQIGPSIDPTSQTLQLRAQIANLPDKVLPGMSVITEF
ncbi:efflux RND transporter periplasmic adaptor subunit [Marinomonas balearica]|uniref:RND family efflux transporter MFP subunit n=1 Tax=Marinomonas balearica TaxID=491947 RepID=A0A4R6M5H2_9GAMM|nr:efflux RND transporter periplasmic adaptor subunit [Marinomonas balearica]TDO96025.1 RND family efflux transporter MFP subunit [Marinomonas balearica]